jgi:hypothetical protein
VAQSIGPEFKPNTSKKKKNTKLNTFHINPKLKGNFLRILQLKRYEKAEYQSFMVHAYNPSFSGEIQGIVLRPA